MNRLISLVISSENSGDWETDRLIVCGRGGEIGSDNLQLLITTSVDISLSGSSEANSAELDTTVSLNMRTTLIVLPPE